MRERGIVVVALVAACRFDPAGVAGDDADPVHDAAAPDAVATFDGAPARLCVDDPALVGCYGFDDGIMDGSAYGNHGTASNATTETGLDGRGLALSVGPASLVSVPDSPSLEIPGPITVELWLRADAAPPPGGNDRAGLVDHNGQWGLFLTSGLQVRCVMAGGASVTGLAVTVGEWTHLACVYDRQTVQLYQDGAAGPSINTSNPNPVAATDGIRIGQDSPSGDPLTGLIDELRIWQIARTADEVCTAADC